MWTFKKPKPEKPFYKKNPVATFAVILTFVGMFILSPISVIYNSMSEELEAKVDNKTLQLLLENQKTLIKNNKEETERQRKEDSKKFEELQRTQQETLKAIQKLQMKQKAPIHPSPTTVTPSTAITKEIFEYYINLPPEQQKKFRNLNPLYQALPPPNQE